MKILVTGSEGNIGTKLVPYLESKGYIVMRCDQVQGFESNYHVVNINSSSDLTLIFPLFEPDIVIHLAAMVSRVTCEKSPGLTVETNLLGLSNVIQLCKLFKVKLMYFSTSEVYGNIGGILSEERECKPNNLYGLTKYMGEKLVEYELKNGLQAITVRPFMFYDEDETRGDHRSAMIRFCYHLSKGEKIEVHKGSLRSWMHITDAVRVLEKLIYVKGYEIINIGSDEIIKTEDLARMICDRIGVEYSDYVIEKELPDKMTLEKIPSVKKQFKLTGIIPEIDLNTGLALIICKL